MLMKMERYGKTIIFIAILSAMIYCPGKLLSADFMTRNHLANVRGGVHAKLRIEPEHTLDILFLGDSECYNSISPMELWKEYGFTSYSAGQPGARLSDTRKVLNTAFETQSPTIVLLETNQLFRHDVNEKDTQNRISMFLYETFPLLKHHNAWKSPLVELRLKTYKGFPINAKVKPYKGSRTRRRRRSRKVVIERDNILRFREIKRICSDNGADLILYSVPSPKNYNAAKIHVLKELAKREGVEYIELNCKTKDMGISWKTDTKDRGDHVNYYGARKVTLYIGRYLSQNHNVTSRADDRCAEEWDRLLKDYEVQVRRTIERARTKSETRSIGAFLKRIINVR